MATSNRAGQILVEVSLVMFFIMLVFMGALENLAAAKEEIQKHQFVGKKRNEKVIRNQIRH